MSDARTPGGGPLDGRVALVTGSSTGLGKAMAIALADAGAAVAMNYANNAQRAEKAFAELKSHGRARLMKRRSTA